MTPEEEENEAEFERLRREYEARKAAEEAQKPPPEQ